MGRFLILSIFIILWPRELDSQNLVQNYSFEEYYSCPNTQRGFNITSNKKLLPAWINPNQGSVDYFNKCSRQKSGIPKNWAGNSLASDGNAYLGIIVASVKKTPKVELYREYIQTDFLEKMKREKIYCIKFMVKHADYSELKSNRIGAYISQKRIKNRNGEHFCFKPQINLDSTIFPDNSNWTEICGVYLAKGGENYITIGNFYSEKRTVLKKRIVAKSHKIRQNENSYYFIDNVSVFELDVNNDCCCRDTLTSINNNGIKKADTVLKKIITLPDLTFESGKWDLISNINSTLDSLAEYLISNNNFRIVITGHTDNVGSEKDNLELSTKRAETIKKYLNQKGVVKERIKIVSLGSKNPVNSNKTEEGRSRNRRVEIELFQLE